MEFVIWVETRIAGQTVDGQRVAKVERRIAHHMDPPFTDAM